MPSLTARLQTDQMAFGLACPAQCKSALHPEARTWHKFAFIMA